MKLTSILLLLLCGSVAGAQGRGRGAGAGSGSPNTGAPQNGTITNQPAGRGGRAGAQPPGPPFRPRGWDRGEKRGWGNSSVPPGLAGKIGGAVPPQPITSGSPTGNAIPPVSPQNAERGTPPSRGPVNAGAPLSTGRTVGSPPATGSSLTTGVGNRLKDDAVRAKPDRNLHPGKVIANDDLERPRK